MGLKRIFQVFFYSALITGVVYVAGCSKNERAIEEVRFTSLSFKTFSVDTTQLKVLQNETMLTDSLFTPDGADSIPIQYFDAKNRIRLYDMLTNRLWLDTTVDFKSGSYNHLTFFQPSEGENFIWIGPPLNETLPPAGYVKISIRYAHPKLPDWVKVVVENNTRGTSYSPTDSFELQKNVFSRYFLGYNTSTRKVRLKFYNIDGKRKTLAYVDPSDFSEAKGDDYNIYLFRKQATIMGDSIKLSPDKLY